MSGSVFVDRLRAAGCVYAEDEARLLVGATHDAAELERLVARRVSGEPLEHLLGWADFCGLRVVVTAGIFVPRPRTAVLVEQALLALPEGRAVVVDLCCGSGAIGLVLATRRPDVELHASDLDPAAVACARLNLGPVGGTVHHGDLDAALPTTLRGRVDVLVANVPYVPSAELSSMPAEAREHEPPSALDGGADGLEVVRRLATAAPRWLRPGGAVLVETSTRQSTAAAAAYRAAGLDAHVVDGGRVHVVVGLGRGVDGRVGA